MSVMIKGVDMPKSCRECKLLQDVDEGCWCGCNSYLVFGEKERVPDYVMNGCPLDADALNDAHNEGYDVGYWAGRRDYEPKWIPVTERLPEPCETVLVYRTCGNYGLCDEICFAHTLLFPERKTWSKSGVTHWMPLPEPPKGEE